MLLPKAVVCGSKKSIFFKEQEASGLLGSLGIRKSICKIPSVSPRLLITS